MVVLASVSSVNVVAGSELPSSLLHLYLMIAGLPCLARGSPACGSVARLAGHVRNPISAEDTLVVRQTLLS